MNNLGAPISFSLTVYQQNKIAKKSKTPRKPPTELTPGIRLHHILPTDPDLLDSDPQNIRNL